MASNYTENYGLCQWEATDQVLRTEFNEDNAKIDTELLNLREKNAALEDLVQKCGNCQIYTITYTGNGGSGKGSPNSLTFPTTPVLVLISGGQFTTLGTTAERSAMIISGGHMLCSSTDGIQICPTTWSADKKTVSWYAINASADEQLNILNTIYTAFVFL